MDKRALLPEEALQLAWLSPVWEPGQGRQLLLPRQLPQVLQQIALCQPPSATYPKVPSFHLMLWFPQCVGKTLGVMQFPIFLQWQ